MEEEDLRWNKRSMECVLAIESKERNHRKVKATGLSIK